MPAVQARNLEKTARYEAFDLQLIGIQVAREYAAIGPQGSTFFWR
jgi:hypothetical protein